MKLSSELKRLFGRCPSVPVGRLPCARLLVALFAVLAYASTACAEVNTWPSASEPFSRGLGFYLSPVRIGFVIGLFWVWIKATEWVATDCFNIRWNYRVWNPVMVFTFFGAMLLLFLLSSFLLAYFLLLLALFAPLTTYILLRNKRVEEHERVLTREHIRHLIADRGKSLGVKVSAQKKLAQDAGPPVNFTPIGGVNDGANQAALLVARQSPGFVTVKELIAETLERRADGLQIESSAVQVVMQHQIDGVLHPIKKTHERVPATNAIATLLLLAGQQGKDRRGTLTGKFLAELSGVKYECRFTSQGTPTGEKAMLQIADKKMPFSKPDELGLRTKIEEQLVEVYKKEGGLILFSALPGNGLTTTIDVFLKSRDRYMREHATIEDVARRERDTENVHVTTYDSSKGESPATVLPKLVRTYPNVIVCRDIPNVETVKILCEQPAEDRMVVATLRAKDCTDALLRVLALKIPPKEFATAVSAVVNQRLIRKLCDKCRAGFAPSAELLKQLGLPEGRISTMYNATVYQPPIAGQKSKLKPCEQCGGIGYFGRTALFELLVVNNEVREAIIKTPKPETIKLAARKAGMKTLQEEGILLAAKGVISIQELQRILKQ